MSCQDTRPPRLLFSRVNAIAMLVILALAAVSSLASLTTPHTDPNSRAWSDLLFVLVQNFAGVVSVAYLSALVCSVFIGWCLLSRIIVPSVFSVFVFIFLSFGPWTELLSVSNKRCTPLQSKSEANSIMSSVFVHPRPIRSTTALVPRFVHISLSQEPPVLLDCRDIIVKPGAPARLSAPALYGRMDSVILPKDFAVPRDLSSALSLPPVVGLYSNTIIKLTLGSPISPEYTKRTRAR